MVSHYAFLEEPRYGSNNSTNRTGSQHSYAEITTTDPWAPQNVPITHIVLSLNIFSNSIYFEADFERSSDGCGCVTIEN